MIKQNISEIKFKAKEEFVPIVRDKTLSAMLELIKEIKPKQILEIGTATGYSALNMCDVCNSFITTIEKNKDRAEEAKLNFKKAGVEGRISLINADAMEILSSLKSQQKGFDFIFLDGPKGQYIRYLPFLLDLITEKGVIFADNVGLLGLVADEKKVNHRNRTMVRNMQAFIKEIQENQMLDVQFYDIDDGYAVIRKK